MNIKPQRRRNSNEKAESYIKGKKQFVSVNMEHKDFIVDFIQFSMQVYFIIYKAGDATSNK